MLQRGSPKNERSRSPSGSTGSISHCHTTRQSQPKARACVISRASRSRFLANFAAQKSGLVLGTRQAAHPSCACQKHPCTNIAFLRFVNAMSGRPGTLES